MWRTFKLKSWARFATAIVLLAVHAAGKSEGGIGHGGGKGVICQTDGKPRVYLADTFDLVYSGELNHIKPLDPVAIVEAAAEIIERIAAQKKWPPLRIDPRHPEKKVSLGWLVRVRSRLLSYVYKGKLRAIDDDHLDLSKFPENCRTKVQLADQDFSKGEVAIDYDLVSRLTWLENGFLKLHETLLAIRNAPGVDTTAIREQVNEVARLMGDQGTPFYRRVLAIVNPGARPSRLMTLIRVPRHMSCFGLVGGSGKIREFEIDRIGGDGRPRSENTFTLTSREGRGTRAPISSENSFFSTHFRERDSGYRSYGMATIQMTFLISARRSQTLFLYSYDRETGEFSGNIMSRSSGLLDRHSSMQVSCRADAEYGYDPDQSLY